MADQTVTLLASKCGHHFDPDCTSCKTAFDCTNAEIRRLHDEIARLREALEQIKNGPGAGMDYRRGVGEFPISPEEHCAKIARAYGAAIWMRSFRQSG